jgi:hypothetical protein
VVAYKFSEEELYWAEEISKVYDSFEYYCSEYVQIEDKTTGAAIPFRLWPGQRKILPILVRGKRGISLKARQLGITWMLAALALWRVQTRHMYECVVISAKEEWAVEFLDRVWFIFQRLPHWLQPEVDKRNESRLRIAHRNSSGTPVPSQIKSLTTTVTGAQSKTPNLLILDETARNPHVRSIYDNSKPGIDAAGGQIFAISNAMQDGVGWGWTRDTYVSSMRNENDFARIFMPWWDRPDRPSNFRELQIQEGMHPDSVAQQYPESEDEAITSVFGSYFAQVLKTHTEPRDGTIGHLTGDDNPRTARWEPAASGPLCVWDLPYRLDRDWDGQHWSKRYALGSDVSEGLGQSYSVAYVIDRLTNQIVARLRSNRVDAYQWANMIFRLSWWYAAASDPALICAERTGAGQTVVKRLRELRALQYIRQVPDKAGNTTTKEFGWSETQQAKFELCADLFTYLRQSGTSVPCGILIDELSTYIRHDNGRLDPEAGRYGDCVIAAGCAVQASLYMGEAPKMVGENVMSTVSRQAKIEVLDSTSQMAQALHQRMLEQMEEAESDW